MKQKDIITIAVVVFVSAIASFFITGKVIVASSGHQTAPVVDIINSTFTEPDTNYFNKNSIDPTQLIHIGTSTNPNPFSAQ